MSFIDPALQVSVALEGRTELVHRGVDSTRRAHRLNGSDGGRVTWPCDYRELGAQ